MFDRKSFFEIADWAISKYLSLKATWLNKITHLIVFAGITICSQPIWEPILVATLSKYLLISVPDGPSPWLGVSLVIIGLVFNYAKQKNERGELSFAQKDIREHDSNIMCKLCEIAKFSEIRSIISWIETNIALFNADRNTLRDTAIFLRSPENKFLDLKISEAANLYDKSLASLISFLTTHFFAYPNHPFGDRGYQYCLYPDLNPDRGGSGDKDEMTLYNRREDELLVLTAEVITAQQAFIHTGKQILGPAFP